MKTGTQLWNFGQDLRVEPSDLIGYDVEASDGHIGKIDKASEDTTRRYLVVDTGFWIFGKKRMVPAGLVSRVDHDDRRLFISMTKDQVKSAPDFDALQRDRADHYDDHTKYYSPYL